LTDNRKLCVPMNTWKKSINAYQRNRGDKAHMITFVPMYSDTMDIIETIMVRQMLGGTTYKHNAPGKN